MIPIPSPVTQVRIFPYIPDSHIIVPPVFISGTGTYSVGTLGKSIFYNLDLTAGESQNGGPHAGNKYYAICKGADGKEFTTTWLTCLKGGSTPQFGRTITLGRPSVANGPLVSNDYTRSKQVHLSDITVNAFIQPDEPLSLPLIANGNGIASFVGQFPGGFWSVTVTGGEYVNPLQVGMTVTIQGINTATGKPCFIPAIFVTEDASDPAEFVEHRIPRDL
ncbi:hypothetical protein C2134_15680 [Chromobacterium sinusclupearum]|uniref:Uncharacterized protein n=1 Tax=Chromobacterium sinusclupearum TaxID=2077146 RepID=A0A2K4MKK8_9NEIS|nr:MULTISPECIES: hypothetical protein [Chromobacterium]POA97285.1 hypothetical protein C2134_15680 [Chromobacterium sinusclupearum]